jgi:hypothetical protein
MYFVIIAPGSVQHKMCIIIIIIVIIMFESITYNASAFNIGKNKLGNVPQLHPAGGDKVTSVQGN